MRQSTTEKSYAFRVGRAALFIGLLLIVALAVPNVFAADQHEEPAAEQHEEPAVEQHEATTSEQHDGEGTQASHEGEGEHAEEGEHGAAAASHGMPWSEVIFRWINFVLLSALMYWMIVIPPPFIQDIFSFPGLRVVMANRSEAIVSAKALAKKQQQEAEQILTVSAERLAKIEGEVDGLLAQARADGKREQQTADENGRAQADKIRELAKRELGTETSSAQRKLREHVAQLAVGMAEKLIRENLGREDQQRLVDDYISRLGERVV